MQSQAIQSEDQSDLPPEHDHSFHCVEQTERSPPRLTKSETKPVRIPDHSITGDGSTTVYLFHGAYGSKEYWKFMIERLVTRGFRVVAWDAPGYGLSPLPEPVTLQKLADAAAVLVARTATERNIVFGHSMGGQLAPRIFARVGGLINALVISSTIGWFGNTSPEDQETFVQNRLGGVANAADMKNTARQVVTSMFGPDSRGNECELVTVVAASTQLATFKAVVGAIKSAGDEEAISAYSRISVPTLLLAGELDNTGKVSGMRRLNDLIKSSSLTVIDGVGHYGWAEKPDQVMAALDEFFARHGLTPARTASAA